MKVTDTELSRRAKNALRRNGIFTTGEMHQRYRRGRLHQCKGVGDKTITEITQWLNDHPEVIEEGEAWE